MTDYLGLADIIAIHADQIQRYGGADGIRDPGQLEAALYRSQSGYYADLISEAAALWESLSQNHPFVDGNKRTAFASVYTFLAINEIEIVANADNTYSFMIDLYERNCFEIETLEHWLRLNTRSI